jgi:hypothetical protein
VIRVPRRDLAVAGVFGLVVLAVFSDALLGSRVFYQRDLLSYWYTQMELVRALADRGLPPWWNPYIGFGAPLFADANFQLAYPPTWLVLLLPPATYFKIYVGVHVWLGAFATHGLARRLGCGPWPSVLAGISFACSGAMLSSVSVLHHVATAAWMPAVLWAVVAALEEGTTRAILRLAALAGLEALSGSADVCAMTAIGAFFVMLLRWPPPWRHLMRVVGVSAPLAAALAAVQWLPTFALLAGSPRSGFPAGTNLFWSLHPLRLAELVVPRLFSDLAMSPELRAALFESREPYLASVYLGAGAAVLAALGAVQTATGRRVALGFVLFLALALGRHTPLLPLLLHVPPFGVFRFPEKYMLGASLFFALLVAVGAEAWLGAWDAASRRRGALTAGAALLVAIALLAVAYRVGQRPGMVAGWVVPAARVAGCALVVMVGAASLLMRLRTRHAGAGLAVLGIVLVADLVLAGRGVNPLASPELLTYRPPVLSVIGPQRSSLRVLSHPEPWAELQAAFTQEEWGGDRRVAWFRGILDRLVPPSAARFGIRGSFDGDFSGFLGSQLYALGVILDRFKATALAPRMLQMANVGYVVGLDLQAYGLPRVASFPSVFRQPVSLFAVPDPLPPVFVVDGIRAASEPHSFEVMAGAFDPHREAIVAEGLAGREATPGFRGEARLVSREAARVAVEAELSGPGLLVLVETWARGWSVEACRCPRAGIGSCSGTCLPCCLRERRSRSWRWGRWRGGGLGRAHPCVAVEDSGPRR